MYFDFDTFFFLVCIATVAFVVLGMRRASSASKEATTATQAKPSAREQMVEDIKMTQTSRVVDQVSILDELSQASPNFRQYCELVGTCQREGGVVAPYSRKQVAYYEIRCYRIENHGSGDVETLVAHEKSFDPFYFKDDSCDTPVYVNIDSFGDNVMLVNSTNHIEGPNSDFAKAVSGTSAASATSSTGVSAIVGEITSGVVHGFGRARDAVVAGLRPASALAFAEVGPMGQEGWSRQFLQASGKKAVSGSLGGFAQRGGSMMSGSSSVKKAMKSNATGARPGGQGGQRPSGQAGRPSSQGGSRGNVTINVNVPSGLGTFLGTGRPTGYSNVPRPMPRPAQPYPRQTYRRTGMGDVVGDMITGMVLSSVLDSMASKTTSTQATTQRTTTFRGYRLVEDVVPLGSPIYCIGELYHHGTDVYMGRSLATDYPTSYFATKPEVEVLAALGA